MSQEPKCGQFATVKQISKLFPFSESAMRYLLFHSKQNGLSRCLRRVGRKILISVSEFEDWLNEHREEN